MSWEDQGRQFHGWFGDGTAPPKPEPPTNGAASIFDPGAYEARIDAVAYAAVAHMPQADRQRQAASFDRQRLENLRTAMMAWIGVRSMTDAAFAERLLDPSTGNKAIGLLRAAAEGVRTATTHQELSDAAADLAGAMRSIGLQKWSGFLRDAAERADAAGPPTKQIVLVQAATPNIATDARPDGAAPPAAVPGRYVADNPRQWVGQASVGTGECVPLVRAATGAPRAAEWQRGAQVQGNTAIRPGTAIATFDSNGHYDGHAAIYLGQDENGIRVIDQWNIRQAGRITGQNPPSERILHLGEPNRARVDRGEMYYVVE